MTFFCDSCGQPLLLEGDPSPGLRVSCPSCQATVEVPLPAGDEPLELSWFAMVRGSQVGPMPQGPLEQLIRAGEVTGKSFVWCEGMAEWRRAETLPQLAQPLAATRPPKPASTADLSQLFSDLDLTVSRPMDARAVEQMLSGSRAPKAALAEPVTAPVRSATRSTPTVSTATRRSRRAEDDEDLEASGLARRSSPWKVVLAVVLILAVPVAGLYALSSLQVFPLEIPQVDPATGASVKEPIFSAKGVRGLKALLLGSKPPSAPPPREVRAPAPKPAPAPAPAPKPEPPPSPELKKLYGDTRKADVGPTAVPSFARAGGPPASGGGPNQQALAKVVAQSGPAFQSCIEQQLRRTPNFRGGKVNLVATVGASGTVKQARLDRKEIDLSDLGSCLKSRARRLVFPSFEGEDVEVEIPLVLTAAL